MGKRVLISGAQGFVGRYLVAHLLEADEDIEVLGVGRSPSQMQTFTHVVRWGSRTLPAPLTETLQIQNPRGRYRYRVTDIGHRAELCQRLRDFRPHVVIHLASGLRDDAAEYLFRTNVEGTIHLIEAIAASGIELDMLILGSTGGVYGRPEAASLPLAEEAPCEPIDLYASSKLAAEHASRILTTRYGIPTIWARLFNLVGAGQDRACCRFATR